MPRFTLVWILEVLVAVSVLVVVSILGLKKGGWRWLRCWWGHQALLIQAWGCLTKAQWQRGSDFNNRVSLHTLKQKARYMRGPRAAGRGWAHPPPMTAQPSVLWWLLETGQAVLQPPESCCSCWIGGANLLLPKRPLCPEVLGFNWLVHTFSSRLWLLTLPPHPTPSLWFTVSTGLEMF